MTRTNFPIALLALFLVPTAGLAQAAGGGIRVSPTSATVNTQGPTTAILTFSGLGGYAPAEGTWCAKLIQAADRTERCNASAIYGQVPGGTRAVPATGVFTDVMSVPAAVAQRAYDAALAGEPARFFYVRRFQAPAMSKGPGVDQYISVSLVLGGSGANAPFTLTNVRLRVEPDAPVIFVKRGDSPPRLTADIAYSGSGRLRGRWEVVMPGETGPTPTDLMTEGSLPSTERGLQRRYREVQRFNVLLLPTGRIALPGPDPSRLPTSVDGTHTILLRIETSDDASSKSRPSAAGSEGVVIQNGASAGFPMPTMRYVVGATGARVAAARIPQNVRLRFPLRDAQVSPDSGLTLSWTDVPDAARYRVDLERVTDGTVLLSAVVAPGVGRYSVPPFALAPMASGSARWRVTALDAAGRETGRSEWRRFLRRPAP